MLMSGLVGSTPFSCPLSRRVNFQRGRTIAYVGRDETPEQALERRMKESARVEEKIRYIYNRDDFHRELAEGGKNLIVLEVSEGPISPKR